MNRAPSSTGTAGHITFAGLPRLRAVRNAMRTGHCAPTVMRTLQDLRGADSAAMVRLVSAMGGGVGMLRNECGAASAPVLFLGLVYGREAGPDGIPKVITLGQDYLRRFSAIRGGVRCREVIPTFQHVGGCLQVMSRAPGLLIEVIRRDQRGGAAPGEAEGARTAAAMLRLFDGQGFHCSHSVLRGLQDSIGLRDEHFDAAFGLVGGAVFQGMTCSALAAGVLAIGLKFGGFENSHLRTAGLLLRIAAGLDFMREEYNAFNKSMNIANRLGLWFRDEFGATECRDLLALDFKAPGSADRYLAEHKIDACRGICARVTAQVRRVLETGE